MMCGGRSASCGGRRCRRNRRDLSVRARNRAAVSADPAHRRRGLRLLRRAGGRRCDDGGARRRPVVGFIVLVASVDHLLVDAGAQRPGIDSILLRHAQALRTNGLDLWRYAADAGTGSGWSAAPVTYRPRRATATGPERGPDFRRPSSINAPAFGCDLRFAAGRCAAIAAAAAEPVARD